VVTVRAALLALALAAGPVPVAVLPVNAPELPREAAAAADALGRALPPPFAALGLDGAAIREHLAAAGPACRRDPACLCAAAGLAPGQLALDLDLAPVGAPASAWAADLRLLAPCEGRLVDRRAEMVAASGGALQRFLEESAAALLRGRDLARVPTPGLAPAAAAAPATTRAR
jgi:hypothetical protein